MAKAKRIGIILLALALVLGAISFAADRWMLDQTYARFPANTASVLPVYEDYDATAYPRTDVEFELDGYTLRGHVYGPENTRGLIVLRHGIFSQHQDYLCFITAFVDRGWRVFAYDAIGCGESDGDSTLGMSQSPIDVAAAVDFARESGMADGLKIALVGHSWGGYGVAAALGRTEDIAACVTMSGYDTPMKVINYSAVDALGPVAITQAPLLGFITTLDFGADANISASQAIRDSGVPTLVVHGMGDKTVPYEDVSIAYQFRGSAMDAPSNVSVMTLAEEGRDGHNTYFFSRESQMYFDECMAKMNEIVTDCGDDPTAPEVGAFRATVDIPKANTANPELVKEIDAFLGAHLD